MHAYLQMARDAVDGAAGALSPDVIERKIGDQWSIAEILEHLTLAFTGHAAALEKALAAGQPRARTPVLKQRLIRMVVSDLGYFPRVEAPSATRPSGTIPSGRAVQAAREALSTLDDALSRAAEKFGEDVAVSNHPYFAGMSVRQWRKFHWRHTVHHMKQVQARSQ